MNDNEPINEHDLLPIANGGIPSKLRLSVCSKKRGEMQLRAYTDDGDGLAEEWCLYLTADEAREVSKWLLTGADVLDKAKVAVEDREDSDYGAALKTAVHQDQENRIRAIGLGEIANDA
jgi:hypothetical protein